MSNFCANSVPALKYTRCPLATYRPYVPPFTTILPSRSPGRTTTMLAASKPTLFEFAVNRTPLPSGSTCGQRCDVSPGRNSVTACTSPPDAATRPRLFVDPRDKTMCSSPSQLPPRGLATSTTSSAAPPSMATRFKLLRSKKPTHFPLAETNGECAPSVPGNSTDAPLVEAPHVQARDAVGAFRDEDQALAVRRQHGVRAVEVCRRCPLIEIEVEPQELRRRVRRPARHPPGSERDRRDHERAGSDPRSPASGCRRSRASPRAAAACRRCRAAGGEDPSRDTAAAGDAPSRGPPASRVRLSRSTRASPASSRP